MLAYIHLTVHYKKWQKCKKNLTKKLFKQCQLYTFGHLLSSYHVSYAYYDIQITTEVKMFEVVKKKSALPKKLHFFQHFCKA